jgi:hypothetical protein
MDNTDTPLNTMMKLKEKQAATGSAYIVLPTKGAAAPQERYSALARHMYRSPITYYIFAHSISLQKDTSKRKADGATKAAKKKPKS